MKKVITLLLSIVLVFGVMSPAALATSDDDLIEPHYFRINTLDIGLDIDSSGKSTCYSKVVCSDSTDTVDLTMELQRLEDDDWNTIKTWSDSGTYRVSLNKNWYVVSGYDYQVKITAKVYDSTGKLRETQVDYSHIHHY